MWSTATQLLMSNNFNRSWRNLAAAQTAMQVTNTAAHSTNVITHVCMAPCLFGICVYNLSIRSWCQIYSLLFRRLCFFCLQNDGMEIHCGHHFHCICSFLRGLPKYVFFFPEGRKTQISKYHANDSVLYRNFWLLVVCCKMFSNVFICVIFHIFYSKPTAELTHYRGPVIRRCGRIHSSAHTR